MVVEENIIDCFLEYFIELPFNLALPTGHYALNFPNQMKIHRDMYYIQKGNELENISTLKTLFEPQERLYDDKGLTNKNYSEYQFKKKMKTVIFARYKQKLKLSLNEEEFHKNMLSGKVNAKNLNISPAIIKNFYQRFKNQVNEFIKYYVNFFPDNNNHSLIQHEIRTLSKYEFSRCETGIALVYKNVGILIPPIIEDYDNYAGIPEHTCLNLEKIEEFEKLILKRKEIKIVPYQEMFNLARSLYRTNKKDMFITIIVNTFTAIESLLNVLETKDDFFKDIKNYRKLKEGILSFYFNPNHMPKKQGKTRRIDLARTLKKNNNNIRNLKESRQILKYLNYGRLIRNEIIHESKLRYNQDNDLIRFRLIPWKLIKKVKFSELWSNILKAYDALNCRFLELKYPSIYWRYKSNFSNSIIAIAVSRSEAGVVSVIPNYDWRETFCYNYELPAFTIPPEKFPIGINTTDHILINLNIDYGRDRYEVVNQVIEQNGESKMKWLTWDVNVSSEEIMKMIKNKNFNISINQKGQIYNFRSCENCGYLIPVHRHEIYNIVKCPKCKSTFDLKKWAQDMWFSIGVKEYNSNNYKEAINFFNRVLVLDGGCLDAWNMIGVCLMKLNQYSEAEDVFKFILKIDNKYGNSYYNLACIKALTNDPDNAINYLNLAIEIDEIFKDFAKDEQDFSNLKDKERFKTLLGI